MSGALSFLTGEAAAPAWAAIGVVVVKVIDWLIARRAAASLDGGKAYDAVNAAQGRLAENLFKQIERLSAELERLSAELEEEQERRFKAERMLADLDRQVATLQAFEFDRLTAKHQNTGSTP